MPRINYKHSEETKRKIGLTNSISIKKLWENPEYRKHMSKVHLGQKSYWKGKEKLDSRGEKHPLWKGKDVGYTALHDWVKRYLGSPDVCEDCGNKDLRHRQYTWANISGKYKRELSDWKRLCMKCHKKFDRKTPLFCKCGNKYYAKGMCRNCYEVKKRLSRNKNDHLNLL